MFNEYDVRCLFVGVSRAVDMFIIAEGLRTTSFCTTSKGRVQIRLTLLKEGEDDRQNPESIEGNC